MFPPQEQGSKFSPWVVFSQPAKSPFSGGGWWVGEWGLYILMGPGLCSVEGFSLVECPQFLYHRPASCLSHIDADAEMTGYDRWTEVAVHVLNTEPEKKVWFKKKKISRAKIIVPPSWEWAEVCLLYLLWLVSVLFVFPQLEPNRLENKSCIVLMYYL